MWKSLAILRLFTKSLVSIANSLVIIQDMYRLDLASRGIIQTDYTIKDELEIAYGYQEVDEED